MVNHLPDLALLVLWRKIPRWGQDVILLVIAVGIALLLWTGQAQKDVAYRKADHSACVRIELLKRGFRDSLKRGLNSIPTISYYRMHPKEKAKALRELHRQIRLYAPVDCN